MAKARRNKKLRKTIFVPKKKLNVDIKDWDLTIKECYLGNPTVKSAHIRKKYTKEQLVELYKCSKSVEYFAEYYCQIVSVDVGLVPYKPYDFQRVLLNKFQNSRFIITLQARQTGKSISTACYILWFALFHSHKECAICSNKEAGAKSVLLKITNMYKNLPFFMQQGAVELNKKSITFENESKILAAATSSDGIRGESIALLYWDEAAFTAQDQDFFTSIQPTISSGSTTKMIISSTPNGASGVFHSLYYQAELKLNNWDWMKVLWDEVPGRGEAWKKMTLDSMNGNMSRFKQEHCCSFLGSTGGLISMEYFENMFFKNPVKEIGEFLNIYEESDPTHKYLSLVDWAGGGGGDSDSSTIQVIDVTELPYKQVATYRNNGISPMLFPYTIVSVCEKYNECPVLIENNHRVGGTVSYAVYHMLEYAGCLPTSTDKIRSKKIYGKNSIPGIEINNKIKAIGCSTLKTLIENDRLVLVDDTTIQELGTFIANKAGTYEAAEGCHDDTISPLVLFGWLTQTAWFDDYFNINISENIYKHQKELMKEDLLPFIRTNDEGLNIGDDNVVENARGGLVIEPSMF